MLESIRNRFGQAVWFWPLLIIYIANQSLIAVVLGEIRHDLLPLQLSFTVENFKAVTQAWSPEAWQDFRNHFYPDMYHPILYGAGLLAGLGWGLNLNGFSQKANFIMLCGIIAPACDLVENVLHILVAYHVTGPQSWLVLVSSSLAAIKWSLAAVGIVSLMYFGLRYLVKVRTGKAQAPA